MSGIKIYWKGNTPFVQRRVPKHLLEMDSANWFVHWSASGRDRAEISIMKKHLCLKATERSIRRQIMGEFPSKDKIESKVPVNIQINVADVLDSEEKAFDAFVKEKDLAALVQRYPIRETGALDKIAKKIGFNSKSGYQGAVRKLLQKDKEALEFVRSLFGNLITDMQPT